MKLFRQTVQPRRGVKRGVALMEQIARGVIDIEQHGMKAAGRIGGIDPRCRWLEHPKEISLHEATSRIAAELFTKRNQAALVPSDDRSECFHDNQASHRIVREGGCCGVAQSESAHHDVHRSWTCWGEAQVCERDFDSCEQAGHEESLSQLHFEHFEVAERSYPPPAQDEFTQRGLAVIQLFEVSAHCAENHLSGCAWRGSS